MDTKQPEALAQECADYATSLRSTINVVQLEGREPPTSFLRAAELFERAAARIAALDALRASYDAALDEIASLQARVQELGKAARDVNSRRVQELETQLAAVGAGGVEPLRKRCLHQISEPAQPVGWAIFAENGNGLMWTQNKGHAEASAKNVGLQVTPLYAAPQPAAPAQAATAKQSPHPEYDKGFSDGWNRCEERQAAAPAQAGEREFVSRAGWVESAMRVYLIAGDTEKEARECAEYLWSEADMDDLPDPIGAAMEDCEGRGAAQAAPVEAENEIDLLAEAALCERLDACLAAARAAQGIK